MWVETVILTSDMVTGLSLVSNAFSQVVALLVKERRGKNKSHSRAYGGSGRRWKSPFATDQDVGEVFDLHRRSTRGRWGGRRITHLPPHFIKAV